MTACLAVGASYAEPKTRKLVDIPLHLPRAYVPAALTPSPIDKTLRVGIVPPKFDRAHAAKMTNPVRWTGRPLFGPVPKENVLEVDLFHIDAVTPINRALPTIFRRLFPKTKILTSPDCLDCDLIFVVGAESEAIANDQGSLVGISVRISFTVMDRSGVAVASFTGEGAAGRTRKISWSSHTGVRGIGNPALQAAMESIFSRLSEDASLREVAQDKLAERARPSDLETTVAFDDTASFFPNGFLDAGEHARLRIRIRNRGTGPAFGVRLRLSAAANGVTLPSEIEAGGIAAGATKETDVPLSAAIDVSTGQQQLRVETHEKRGYGGRPVLVQLATERLKKPTLKIADIRLEDRGGSTSGDGDGRPSNGETVEAVILISNSGPGDAAGAALTISSLPGIHVGTPSAAVGAIPINAVKEVRTLLRVPIPFAGPDLGLNVQAVETRGETVATVEEQREWPLLRKQPEIEIGFRLFDGNSPKSRGNRDGVANNGETLEVTLIPSNRGALSARDVRLTLATPVSGVEIKPAVIEIGELPSLAEGAEHRIQLTIPRMLREGDVLQRLPLNVAIVHTDFSGGVQLLQLPFAPQRPALAASLAGQSPMVEGKPALFALDMANKGPLAAEDVKVEVTSDNPAVELLDALGKPARTLRLDVGSLASEAARRIQLRAHIRRNVAAVAALLKVSITQRDFDAAGAQAAITILKEEPAVISTLPQGPVGQPAPRGVGTPATVSFQRYPDGSQVAAASVRLTFEVQSQTPLEMVRLEQDHRTIELPEIVPIHSGGAYVWQYEPRVHLEYGPNEFQVVVVTSDGLRNSRSMTLHREKPRGKVWLAVVGISSYREPSIQDLSFAKDDAIAVRAYYQDRGVPDEQIITLLDADATLANVKRSLGTELVKRAANPDDTVLIYFAGHGVMEADRSSADADGYSKYLLPHDAIQADLFGSALSMEELSRILQRLRAERVVLIIDSCFSGAAGGRTPFEPNAASRGVITDEFLMRMAGVGKGRVILTASGSREVAQESPEMRHGIFTYFLLEGLRGAADVDRDGQIDVDEIYKFVSQKVSSATHGRQTPMRKSPNLSGSLIVGGRLQ